MQAILISTIPIILLIHAKYTRVAIIGVVSWLVGVIAEQHHDDNGLNWPNLLNMPHHFLGTQKYVK